MKPAEPYRITFFLEGLPRVTVNARIHWAQKHKETTFWKNLVHLTTLGNRPSHPLKKARLTLVRYSSVECDFDNLASSWKPIIDGLVECKILENDRQSNIGQPKMIWEKAPPKKGRVFIAVEEIQE